MAKYRVKKPVIVQAIQWFKNGDHPDDNVGEVLTDSITKEKYVRQQGAVVRFFRRPDLPGERVCLECDKTLHEHGWIDSDEDWRRHYNDGAECRVCPGDWVVTGLDGEYFVFKPANFHSRYEAVKE